MSEPITGDWYFVAIDGKVFRAKFVAFVICERLVNYKPVLQWVEYKIEMPIGVSGCFEEHIVESLFETEEAARQLNQ